MKDVRLAKGWMVLMLAVVLIASAYAEDVLVLDFEIYRDDAVVKKTVQVQEGRPTLRIVPGNYSLHILDKQGNILVDRSFRMNFYVMTDPPQPIDPAPFSARLPFAPGSSLLRLYHGPTMIYEGSIDLCDHDGLCESGETYLSCQDDCPLGSPDGTCIDDRDEICDPDCNAGVDPDCLRQTTACGNGRCDGEETASSCPADCSANVPDPCGDGTCDADETSASCPEDCKAPGAGDGDGPGTGGNDDLDDGKDNGSASQDDGTDKPGAPRLKTFIKLVIIGFLLIATYLFVKKFRTIAQSQK